MSTKTGPIKPNPAKASPPGELKLSQPAQSSPTRQNQARPAIEGILLSPSGD
ncbi:hypothetical protein ABZ252_07055 [Streptomyces sp. NPDC006175]|uniref:hypothetical protein n=1 Tax=unclassified Streptomyces TaxID=2593676 RepID=UPI0033A2AC8C